MKSKQTGWEDVLVCTRSTSSKIEQITPCKYVTDTEF